MSASRSSPSSPPRRNKAFEETHARLIESAVRLISQSGVEALSLAGLAREAGVNRATVYYHFTDRDALVRAVRSWSAQQLASAFASVSSTLDRARYITRFVLENPELIRLWIDDFLSPGDIRERYPEWDNLVAGVGEMLAGESPGVAIDPEVYCVSMLTTAMIGPRVYHLTVRPDLDREEAIARFAEEQIRLLARDGVG